MLPPTFQLSALATVISYATTWGPGGPHFSHPRGSRSTERLVTGRIWDGEARSAQTSLWFKAAPHLPDSSTFLVSLCSLPCVQSLPHPGSEDREGLGSFLDSSPGLILPTLPPHPLGNEGPHVNPEDLGLPAPCDAHPHLPHAEVWCPGAQGRGTDACSPPATYWKKIIFYNCWTPD